MKPHRFPVYKTDTITRANVTLMLAMHPNLSTPEQMANVLCGVGRAGNTHAKLRHVERCRKLMQPQEV